VVEEPALTFAGLLQQLRAEARLTQGELAEAAGLSPRSVSDLERALTGPRARRPLCCWRPAAGGSGRCAVQLAADRGGAHGGDPAGARRRPTGAEQAHPAADGDHCVICVCGSRRREAATERNLMLRRYETDGRSGSDSQLFGATAVATLIGC
jgi:hypothetical protein